MAWYRCIGSNKGGGGGEPCLVSTGHEFFYIPTSIFSPASNYRLEFKLMLISSDVDTCPLGRWWGGYGLWVSVGNYANDRGDDYGYSTAWKGLRVGTGGTGTTIIPVEIGVLQEWAITHDDTARTGSAVVDGVSYQLPNGGSDSTPVSFFGLINSGDTPWRCCACAFSEIKIYNTDNDELIVDLVPHEDSDGNGYYHDEVNGDDYYSLTSNNFRYAIF